MRTAPLHSGGTSWATERMSTAASEAGGGGNDSAMVSATSSGNARMVSHNSGAHGRASADMGVPAVAEDEADGTDPASPTSTEGSSQQPRKSPTRNKAPTRSHTGGATSSGGGGGGGVDWHIPDGEPPTTPRTHSKKINAARARTTYGDDTKVHEELWEQAVRGHASGKRVRAKGAVTSAMAPAEVIICFVLRL